MGILNSILKKGLLLIVIMLSGKAAGVENELEITYLANCGFLYESKSEKILIDPFGCEYGDYFYLPSKETKNKIIKEVAPFDSIDLLLITHVHGDHFNSDLAEQFLLQNKKCKMICPSQVYNQMKDSCLNFNQIKSQIASPQLIMNEFKEMEVKKIPVKIIRMQHGTDRSIEGLNYSEYTDYEKTENFGYVIDLNGKTIFHQGDACLKINKKALANLNSKIDIAHLSFFDWDTTSYNFVKNELKADKVIFMHETIPAEEFDKEEFKATIPKLVFFKKGMEKRIFN